MNDKSRTYRLAKVSARLVRKEILFVLSCLLDGKEQYLRQLRNGGVIPPRNVRHLAKWSEQRTEMTQIEIEALKAAIDGLSERL